MKGLAYAGAIEVLDSLGVTNDLKKVAGTSSGALNGFLVSIGFSGNEITAMNLSTNFGKYRQVGFPVIGGLIRLKRQFGYYKTDRFTEAMEEALIAKGLSKDLTFRQLFELSQNNSKFKELYVTGTNLERQETEVFSHLTYPNMRLVDAVTVSLSIPLFFEAQWVDRQGGIHAKKESGDSSDVFVDGGLTFNYPIHIFDLARDSVRFEPKTCNPYTLGIKLETFARKDTSFHPLQRDITNYRTFMDAFTTYTHEVVNTQKLSVQHARQTIFIDTNGFNPAVKKVKAKEKRALMEAGKKATLLYFGIHY